MVIAEELGGVGLGEDAKSSPSPHLPPLTVNKETGFGPQMAEVHRKESISVSPEAYVFYIMG